MSVHHKYDRELHSGGSLNEAISTAMVAVVREHIGRAPRSVSTKIRENTVVVTFQDTLTAGERTLVEGGRRDEALALRGGFQEAMRAEASGVVAGLTGRVVVAMVSADHIDPDSAGEVFILDATLDHPATATH